MKGRIIEIVELGQPQSLIQRENAHTTELLKTDLLIEELNEQLRLYNVVGRSEQLVCDCVKCKPFHNESAGYRKHKFCVKNKAN